MTQAVLGADIGGTSSKVVVMGVDGKVLGTGKAPGGNIRSSQGDPYANMFGAVKTALDEARSNETAIQIVAAHLGIAGAGAARFAEIEAECKKRWKDLGENPESLVVSSDLEVAFAGADHGGDGLIIISGTGAVSAAFHDYRLVGRCDGMGWLLGDTGSSTWIGLKGIQAAARGLDYRGPATILSEAMLEALPSDSASTDPRQRLIASVYSLTPSAYGTVAKVVFDCAAKGDLVSEEILNAAVQGLVDAAQGTIEDANNSHPDPDVDYAQAIVFAGAMIQPGGPLTNAVKAALIAETSGVTEGSIYEPGAPIAGALFLAARTASDLSLRRIQEGLEIAQVRF